MTQQYQVRKLLRRSLKIMEGTLVMINTCSPFENFSINEDTKTIKDMVSGSWSRGYSWETWLYGILTEYPLSLPIMTESEYQSAFSIPSIPTLGIDHSVSTFISPSSYSSSLWWRRFSDANQKQCRLLSVWAEWPTYLWLPHKLKDCRGKNRKNIAISEKNT